MKRFVPALLQEKGLAAYRKVLALKYMMLLGNLRERGPGGTAVAQQLESDLAPFASLSMLDIVEDGTPFFWLNVHRFYHRDTDDRSILEPLAGHLLMTAFDAFFDRLEDGAILTVPARPEAELVLPRLGVYRPGAGQPVRLQRLAARRLRVDAPGQDLVDLDLDTLPDAWRQPYLAIGGDHTMRLLQARDIGLFHHGFLDKLAPDGDAVPQLAVQIREALDLIELALPRVAEDLTALVRWYVPLESPNLATTHNSFSAPHMVGTIFLSEIYSSLRLAEAIVHEFHHNELNMLIEGMPVVMYRDDQALYSPWRVDPRPLYGLFHALYVFTGVLLFYTHAEQIPELAAQHAEFHKRRREICTQLRIGLAQVRPEDLEEVGRQVLVDLQQEVTRQEEALGLRRPVDAPPHMFRHLRTWCAENPQLVDQVRHPWSDAPVSELIALAN